jgi:Uma2 family endonuclease
LKPRRCRDFGVPQYWVVDRFTRRVEVYRLPSRSRADRRTDLAEGQPDPSVPALGVNMEALFAGV